MQYTTVDEQGGRQELTEREVTRSEVVHMECKDSGEFAHRELTTFEQSEQFNGETVHEHRGYEEYVHLRSLEDELEFVDGEGTVPPRGHYPEPSPRPNTTPRQTSTPSPIHLNTSANSAANPLDAAESSGIRRASSFKSGVAPSFDESIASDPENTNSPLNESDAFDGQGSPHEPRFDDSALGISEANTNQRIARYDSEAAID